MILLIIIHFLTFLKNVLRTGLIVFCESACTLTRADNEAAWLFAYINKPLFIIIIMNIIFLKRIGLIIELTFSFKFGGRHVVEPLKAHLLECLFLIKWWNLDVMGAVCWHVLYEVYWLLITMFDYISDLYFVRTM